MITCSIISFLSSVARVQWSTGRGGEAEVGCTMADQSIRVSGEREKGNNHGWYLKKYSISINL